MIVIQSLLEWTWREQLAKRAFIESLGIGNSFGGSASQLGTNVSSGAPQFYAELIGEGIHDDALKVEQAVNDLAGMTLEIVDPEVLVSDMPELVDDVLPALTGRTLLLHGLIARCAMLADAPRYEVERPEKRLVRDQKSGAPKWFVKKKVRCRSGAERFLEEREVDGFDRTAQRPMPNAYRKYEWGEPGVRAVADRRYEFLAWALALKGLSESLAPYLSRFDLKVIARVRLPWGHFRDGAAHLVRPSAVVKKPEILARAEAAGMRAAARLQQGEKKVLTAAGT